VTDALGALVAYLLAQPEVGAEVGTRVYGQTLPNEDADHMPRKCIVIRNAGGPGSPNTVRLENGRFDVWSYGLNFDESGELRRVVYEALMAIDRTVQGDTLIHAATPVSGVISVKDPEGQWPVDIETWSVLTATTAVA
jgi:hypothetical protein